MPINPSLDRGFTLTNFKWHLRANGHLQGEKIGACNYLKLSRIPVDIRLYWNKTNDRNTAFSLDELVRGFKIDERDEAGNAKTLSNVFLWSEGEIPQEPLSDLIELEYNGEGAMITPLLGNKSGAIDKIEKVSVVSTLDKVINPIKVISTTNTAGFTISDFYRINANVNKPILKYATLEQETPGGQNLANLWTNRYNAITTYMGWNSNEVVASQILTYNLVTKNNTLNETFMISCRGHTDGANNDCVCYYTPKILVYKNFGGVAYFTKDLSRLTDGNVPSAEIRNCFIKQNLGALKFSIKDTMPSMNVVLGIEWSGANLFPFCFTKIISSGVIAYATQEFTYSEELALYIFKTQETTSYIAPRQDRKTYISLIAQRETTKKADFRFKLTEVSKTSAASETPFLYMGGLEGIKIPVMNGFELAFNNKKSGLDYVVLEIPAGDIYKVELKLLNVYDDTAEGA